MIGAPHWLAEPPDGERDACNRYSLDYFAFLADRKDDDLDGLDFQEVIATIAIRSFRAGFFAGVDYVDDRESAR